MCLPCAFGAVPSAGPGHEVVFPRTAEPLFPEGPAAGGSLTWTGVAGFVLEAGGTRIAFDPFATRPGLASVLLRRARPDETAVRSRFAGLDAVFVGHTHYDHAMDLPAVATCSPRARIHGSRTTLETCRRLGVAEDRLALARDGARVSVGPFVVEPVASAHGLVPLVRLVDRLDLPRAGVPRTPFRWPRGDVFAWRVEAGGRSFHLQGSAGLEEIPLARQSPVDVLVACLAARAGTPRYLARLGEYLRPRVLVPCHHDDFFRPLDEPPRPVRTLAWGAFLREAGALRAAHGTRLVLPPRLVPIPF